MYIHVNRYIYINWISSCKSHFFCMKTIRKRLFNWFFEFIKWQKIALLKIIQTGPCSLSLSPSHSLPMNYSPIWIIIWTLQRETVCGTLLRRSFLQEPMKTVIAKRTWLNNTLNYSSAVVIKIKCIIKYIFLHNNVFYMR